MERVGWGAARTAGALGALLVLVFPAPAPGARERSSPVAPGAHRAARGPARPAPVSLKIVSASQPAALVQGRVRVRVTARRALWLRLFLTAVAPDGGRVVITRPRTIRLGAGDRRRLWLTLLPAARPELSRCGDRQLDLTAAAIKGPGAPPRRRFHARRALTRGTGRCRSGVAGSSGSGIGAGAGLGHAGAGSSGNGQSPGVGGADSNPAGDGSSAHPISYSTALDADRCDPIDPAVCLQPFPNDYYTVPDASTATGRRVNFNLLSMPRNRAQKPIDPTDWNRDDGFSPGSSIITKVPGLETPAAFTRTGAVPITDMARTFDPNQPVVVINTHTRRRQLIWAELDANPQDPSNVNLIIRPGVNFDEGTRYIVALRNLRDTSGHIIPATGAFPLYRDRTFTSNPTIEARRSHFEEIFATLADAGIERGNLYRAWDFTVASQRNLTERILTIRDDAFARLGDRDLSDLTVEGTSPTFTVDDSKTENFTPCSAPPVGCQTGQSDDLIRRVRGHFDVPCYLDKPLCPSGSRFVYPPGSTNGAPIFNPVNTYSANFICNIPRSALNADTVMPVRPLLYGHGLLGTADQINGDDHTEMANRHRIMFCATDWIGMANEDVPNALSLLTDLSQFPTLVDRVQQGMVNFLYLGRLMIHPGGFSSHAAFQLGSGAGRRSVIDTQRLFYNGDSQGGIIGGALTAVAPDFNRAVLGDVGMNYSTLLQRSSDFGTGKGPSFTPPDPANPSPPDPGGFFPEYSYPLYQAYPDELQRPLIFGLMQMLWDRGEADGYAHHMTTMALPNTPPHSVLLHQPFGDHQVANVASETEARTIGARIHTPSLDPSRSPVLAPYYGIAPIPAERYAGPASFVTWDIGPLRQEGGRQVGTPPPPNENVPPQAGEDPHGAPHSRGQYATEDQISEFLKVDGAFVNVCANKPCYAGSWHGPGP